MTAHRFEVFEDKAGRWRWRCVARNGRRVASSGEAFNSHYNAERAISDLLAGLEPLVLAQREAGRVDVIEAVPI